MFKKITILLTIFSVILLAVNFAFAGFGVSPSKIVNDKVAIGSEFVQEINISRSNPDEDQEITASFDSPDEIKGWFSCEPEKLVMKAGEQEAKLKIKIKIPANAEKKEYKGYVRVAAKPVKSNINIKGTGVSVALGGRVDVDLKLTDKEIRNYEIKTIEVPNIGSGKPIKVIVKLQNNGNVYAGPTKVKLDVFDKFRSEKMLAQERKIENQIAPFSFGEVSAEFKHELLDGSYWADVKLYDGEKMVKEDKMPFEIGFVGEKKDLKSKTLNFVNKNQGAVKIGGLLLLLVLAGIAIYIIIKKLSKKTPQI